MPLLHFFPQTKISLSIQLALCIKILSAMSHFHNAPYFSSSHTLHLPSPFIVLFLTHTLSSLFSCHSSPYFISSPTLQIPSPTIQLFAPTIYLICSIFTVLLTSILHLKYTFPLHPFSCLNPHFICTVPL
jgi:hypothetical protein